MNPAITDVTAYVKGGLDPRYASAEARDFYVQGMLTWGGQDRAAAAADFLLGWVTHRADTGPAPDQTQPLAWHRLLGDTIVQVTRAGSAN